MSYEVLESILFERTHNRMRFPQQRIGRRLVDDSTKNRLFGALILLADLHPITFHKHGPACLADDVKV